MHCTAMHCQSIEVEPLHPKWDRAQKGKAPATGAATNERRGMGVSQTEMLGQAISRLVAEQVHSSFQGWCKKRWQSSCQGWCRRRRQSSCQGCCRQSRCALTPAASRKGTSMRSLVYNAAAAMLCTPWNVIGNSPEGLIFQGFWPVFYGKSFARVYLPRGLRTIEISVGELHNVHFFVGFHLP